MDFKNIKFDCRHFKGDIPCIPNKLRGKLCTDCDEYSKISKRILIIKLGAMGDVIRTTPLLIKLKELYPDSHITWITNYPEILPKSRIDNILRMDYNALLFVQNSIFDIALNFDKDKEACLLFKIASAKEKFGFSWSENHIIGLNHAAEDKILTGIFDSYSKSNKKSYQHEIFEICGLKFNNEPNLLEVDERLSKKWEVLKAKSHGKNIVGLNTGCGIRWRTRMWPFEYWISLIKLLQDSDFFPLVLGGESEHQMNLSLSDETKVYYPGHFSLEEFIAILNNCDIIVTAVSMSLHLGTGLGKPIVLFNNIFNKYEFELYGKGIILEPESGCDCYYGSECKRDRDCMFDIKPDVVFGSIQNLGGLNEVF
ncbi:MAG: glycosyltransferase family 9 protein [Chlorobi bacterium]|nr:glycosyltransferase family 9 protein [Chlorobiota bacterium]MCI0716199.1 glycosyltransferase family 9 protein [Chlorobiota bacterium]